MFWILFFAIGRLLFPAGLVVPLLYSLSFIDWLFLLRCLLILCYILYFFRDQNKWSRKALRPNELRVSDELRAILEDNCAIFGERGESLSLGNALGLTFPNTYN